MRRLVLFGLYLASAFSLQAAPITFFGQDLNGDPLARIAFPKASSMRAAFVAQLSGTSTDTLEQLSAGTLTPLALTFSGIASTTLTGGNSAVRNLSSGTDQFGEFPTSGSNYVAADGSSGLTITFSSPITSFGFYGTDFGDFGGANLSLAFTGTTGTINLTTKNALGAGRNSTADGSVLFFGYINVTTPFTSVQILSPNDSFGFDDPIIGVSPTATAPEPGSLLLFASSLLVLCVKVHQRRKKF